MHKKYVKKLAVNVRARISWSVAFLLVVSCASPSSFHGDGRLSILRRFPTLAIQITFDEFFLDEPMVKSYSIAGLPRLNQQYLIGLAVPIAAEKEKNWPPEVLRTLRGVIRFELRNSASGEHRTIEGETGKLFWTGLKGDPPIGIPTSGPDPAAAFFDQSSGGFDELRVEYSPATNGPRMLARVVIMSDIRRL